MATIRNEPGVFVELSGLNILSSLDPTPPPRPTAQSCLDLKSLIMTQWTELWV